jgi:hypothetical protein
MANDVPEDPPLAPVVGNTLGDGYDTNASGRSMITRLPFVGSNATTAMTVPSGVIAIPPGRIEAFAAGSTDARSTDHTGSTCEPSKSRTSVLALAFPVRATAVLPPSALE